MTRKKTPAQSVFSLTALALALALGGLITGGLLYAGPLTPPVGPVTGTYKTLTEVEPRTAINATNTPGDVDSLFKITQPGSYYLTGNITGVVGKHGIEIAASGVTLDLSGFSLQGIAGSLSGVTAAFLSQNLIVRDGTVLSWGMHGIGLNQSAVVAESIIAEGNGQHGIAVGSESVVRSCIGRANTLSGISTGTACAVSACTAASNGNQGISTNSRCSVTGCAVEGNTGDGISGAFNTLIADCSSGSNSASGISLSQGGMVIRCSVSFNAVNGIVTTSDGTIMGNACDSNGSTVIGAGLLVSGSDNRIEGNNCTDADFGIRVTFAGNFIARNICSGNNTNWDVVAGNVCLVVQGVTGAAILGNTGGVAPGSTDPNANFTY